MGPIRDLTRLLPGTAVGRASNKVHPTLQNPVITPEMKFQGLPRLPSRVREATAVVTAEMGLAVRVTVVERAEPIPVRLHLKILTEMPGTVTGPVTVQGMEEVQLLPAGTLLTPPAAPYISRQDQGVEGKIHSLLRPCEEVRIYPEFDSGSALFIGLLPFFYFLLLNPVTKKKPFR
jgi:hypothetical protein